jgi:hypothetical protein
MLSGCELHHFPFVSVLPSKKPNITCHEFWNVPLSRKQPASQQASPTENIFPNKRNSYLRATACHYNKEENLSL